MVREMLEKNIALFCLRINNSTDKMFKLFEDIYNEEEPNNTLIQIIDNKNLSFSDDIVNYAKKVYLDMRREEEQFCLLSQNITLELLKSKYDLDEENPDDNLRFIIGKCSPVLLVPGVYATKLKVEFNCKGLVTEEKYTTLKDIRLFCGNYVCKDESKTSEEHPLLFSLLQKPFGIEIFNENKYGACLGHIASYFQNENECPKVENKRTCLYSKYVKVGYYGGTKQTLKESRCGVEGISNVVQTGDLLFDTIISTFVAKAADSFNTISKRLIKYGYREGFSLGALPNDYRRFLSTNNFATEVFKYQINKLYENTGKQVIIIAHSYGTLLTLTNLIKNEKDEIFLKKIKKFIAMAPPFSGSTKNLDIYFHGAKDFDNNFKYKNNINIPVTRYPIFGQYLMHKSLPTIKELRPLSIAAKIFTDPSYKELGDALRDRLYCEQNRCYSFSSSTYKRNEKFDEIFNGYFPSLLDNECSYEYNIGGNIDTNNRKCYTYIYNVGDCPTIITDSKANKYKPYKYYENEFCNKTGNGYFYQGECNNIQRKCLDEIYYSDKCPNVYSNQEAVKYLIDGFNKHFSKEYGNISESYFESYEEIKKSVKKSIEYHNEINLLKDLPIPPIDTELVYASFYPTLSSLILDDKNFSEDRFEFKIGGDNTVPTWSSLLTGLKWIYDKKKNNLTQKIKLIEYCSRLAQSEKYKYSPKTEQNFGAINCSCIDTDRNVYKDNIDECNHASMLHDNNLFEYIYSVINNAKDNIYDNIESKKEAIKKYDKNFDYIGTCNNDIYNFLNNAK